MSDHSSRPIRREDGKQAKKPRRVLFAWLAFFFLLASWYVLRPLREEMGVRSGLDSLDTLFLATFLAMLVAVPLFSALVARWPRRIFVPATYLFFTANMAALYLWLTLSGGAGQTEGLARDLGNRWAEGHLVAARVFYVWSSVFNLLAVSVFWSLMADLFTHGQGKRMYGYLATGGTLGALAGSAGTALLVRPLGPENLLLVSGTLLLAAVGCVMGATRAGEARSDLADGHRAAGGDPAVAPRDGDRRIGGTWWAGFVLTARSSYLRGVCAYVYLLSLTSSFVYLTQLTVVGSSLADSAERTALFAAMNFAVNGITLLLQALLAGRVMARLGVGVALAVLPLVTLAGLVTLGLAPLLAVVVVFQVVRRATNFGLTRPAREVLFTVIGREAKYKSKSFIDTALVRGSDALNAHLYSLARAAGLSTALIGLAPFCLGWAAVGRWLGRQVEERGARIDRAPCGAAPGSGPEPLQP